MSNEENSFDKKAHWDKIYTTKDTKDVSWYQPIPVTSLSFFSKFNVPKNAKIIDIGGGESFLVDHLLELGYEDITVLDISELSLNRAKERLGEKSKKVKWITSDIVNFQPTEKYDFWHDRAAFHFLTQEDEISKYVDIVQNNIQKSGIMVIGTFSEQGPLKCSAIEIKQYSEASMTKRFEGEFEKIDCFTIDHPTPFDTVQNFVFCSFRKV